MKIFPFVMIESIIVLPQIFLEPRFGIDNIFHFIQFDQNMLLFGARCLVCEVIGPIVEIVVFVVDGLHFLYAGDELFLLYQSS